MRDILIKPIVLSHYYWTKTPQWTFNCPKINEESGFENDKLPDSNMIDFWKSVEIEQLVHW